MHGMSGEKAIISNLISGMAGRTWKLCEMLCNLSTLGDRPPNGLRGDIDLHVTDKLWFSLSLWSSIY